MEIMATFLFSPVVLLLHILVFASFADHNVYSEANFIPVIPGGLMHANYDMDTDIDLNALDNGLNSIKTTMLNTDDKEFPGGGVSLSCVRRIVSGIPIQALDAFGKPQSGILGQNLNSFGNYEECVAIDGYLHSIADLSVGLPYGNTTVKLPIFWGLCMPDSCSEKDIENLILIALDKLNITLLQLNPKPPGDAPPGPIHINTKLAFNSGFICVVTVFSILGLLMLLGAALDLYIQWSETQQNVNTNGYESLDAAIERVPLLSNGTHAANGTVMSESQQLVQKQTPRNEGLLRKFLLCFAVNRSLNKFLNAKQGKDSIGCLNGMRVLSISWVILGHSVEYPLNDLLYYNLFQLQDIVKRLDFAAVLQGGYAVDSFFFLSGCLLAYLTLGKMAKTNGKLPWGLFYFHRFWRLTPVYSVVIIFYIFVAPYIGNGPLWYRYTDHPNCRKYWWRNLLYISNFFPKTEMCMKWSWYLPNDMQFFLISPIILTLLHKVPVVGVSFLSILTSISVIIRIGLTVKYGGGGLLAYNTDGETTGFFDAIYDKPYTRIPPYLVGIALGFAMARRPRIRMRPFVVLLGWLLAAIVGLVVIYVINNTFYRTWSRTEVAIYSGFSSFAWALSLSWVVLACKNGYGGWINSFLSWDLWLPIGRLTYTVYLVHPIVIRTIYYSSSSSFRGVMIPMSAVFTSNIVLAHAVALIVSLAIEYPFANLEKLLIPSNVGKKYSDTNVGKKYSDTPPTETQQKSV